MSEQQPIRKAVVAAAGYGTRFLPQTKAIPKEMLPIVDTPIIQHVVEELVDVDVKDIIIVTNGHKQPIQDHFSVTSKDLADNLKRFNKDDLLEEIEKISTLANFEYVYQSGPYGTAAPILSAEHLIGDEPFIYTFADDFVEANPNRFAQLIAAYVKYGGSILTCVRAEQEEDFRRYGYVGGKFVTKSLVEITEIIEKPGSHEMAPSNLATVSGYLLEPIIFAYLHEDQERLNGGQEFMIQTSMQRMIDDGHKIYGAEMANGRFYDTGNKLDYIKTVIDFALRDELIGANIAEYLRELNL